MFIFFMPFVQALMYTDAVVTTGTVGFVRPFKCPPSGWYEYELTARARSLTGACALICEFYNDKTSLAVFPTAQDSTTAKAAVMSARYTGVIGTGDTGVARGITQLNATAGCSFTCAHDSAGISATIQPLLVLNRVHGSGQDEVARANGVAKKGDGPPNSSSAPAAKQAPAPPKARAIRAPKAAGPVGKAPARKTGPKADLSLRDVLGALDRVEKTIGPIAEAVAPEYVGPARAAYRAGRKVVDAIMPAEHPPHAKNERVTAPVAYGTRIKRGSAHFAKGSAPGSLVVSHTEYLTDVAGSNGGIYIATVDLNPGVFGAFPWLSSVARRFETYRFKRLQYQYRQTTTTGETGVVALASCWNVNDPVPTTKDEVLNFEGTVKSSPWVDLDFNCLHPNLKQRSTYFVRTGPVVPPENETSRGGAENRDVDYNMYDTARLIVLVQDETTGVLGELYVKYEIEFMTPIVEFSPDLACSFTRPNDTTTLGIGAMERDPHSSLLVELSQPSAGIDLFQFSQAFEGVVTIVLVQQVGVGSQVVVGNTHDCIVAPESVTTPGFIPQVWSQASTLTVPVMATFMLKTTGPQSSFELSYTNTAAAGSLLSEPFLLAWVTFSSNNTTPYFDPATTSLDVDALKCLIAENKQFRFTTRAVSKPMTHDEAMARIHQRPATESSSSSSTAAPAARHLPAF